MKVRMSAQPLKVAFDGVMSNRPTLKIDGTLAADAASLRDALQWMGTKPLPGGGFGRFTLKAQTNVGRRAESRSSGVDIALDGNVAEGVLTFSNRRAADAQGHAGGRRPDLTPYVSAFHLMTANAREWNRRPLTLEDLAGDRSRSAPVGGERVIGSSRIGRTAIAANLRSGD